MFRFSALALLSFLLIGFSGCQTVWRSAVYFIPDDTDHKKIFHTRPIAASDAPLRLPQIPNITLPPAANWAISRNLPPNMTAEEFLQSEETNAFIILRNDTIVYEKYFNGYQRGQSQVCFSITKSVVSALAGIALAEGKFTSVEQRVSEILTDYTGDGKDSIRLKHLLNMTSGLNHDEYRKLVKTAKMYYGANHKKHSYSARPVAAPGTVFNYKSVDIMLLGMCIEKVTGMTVSQYAEQKLWRPLGMEYNAAWCLDRKDGLEKMYGGLATNAWDLVKFGRLYLNGGQCNGQQILPPGWTDAPQRRDPANSPYLYYSQCWWRNTCRYDYNPSDLKDFAAAGLHGQMVYVNPKENMVIVRLGKKRKEFEWGYTLSALSRMPQERLSYAVNENTQQKLTGEYLSPDGRKMRIAFRNGKMLLTGGDMKPIELLPETDNDYISFEAEKRVSFQPNAEKPQFRFEWFGNAVAFTKENN